MQTSWSKKSWVWKRTLCVTQVSSKKEKSWDLRNLIQSDYWEDKFLGKNGKLTDWAKISFIYFLCDNILVVVFAATSFAMLESHLVAFGVGSGESHTPLCLGTLRCQELNSEPAYQACALPLKWHPWPWLYFKSLKRKSNTDLFLFSSLLPKPSREEIGSPRFWHVRTQDLKHWGPCCGMFSAGNSRWT